jgi:glycosyltransferase involved in cell wall biosynthesis
VRLSIFMATRDRPKLLPRAIESVLAQDDDRWELCILDNGMTQRSLIPRDPRIVYRWAKATGPADAFQQALELANGDVVMPMGDDDTLAPHTVRTVLDGLGDAEWGYAQTAFQRDGVTQFLLGDAWSLERLRQDYYLGGAVFWRKRLSDRLGGFDTAFDGAADYDLYLRFGEQHTPVFIPEVLYLYNDHPETDTNVHHGRQRDAAERIRARQPRRSVGVVTPWIDHPELLPAYKQATERADMVIVVDNGGAPESWGPDIGVVGDGAPLGFAESNNHGLLYAQGDMDIVVFLNNDVQADPAWIDRIREDVQDGALYGPSIGTQTLQGIPIPYVEGWCVAATRETWEKVGGWDAERFPKPYWEDVELSLRAVRRGVELRRAPWPIRHLGGVSTSTVPGAWDGFEEQRAIVEGDLARIMEGAPA